MRRKKVLLTLTVLVFAMSFFLSAETEKKILNGNLLFGYRFVDTAGTIEKYREDINLDDGLRLFRFNLQITPNESFQGLFDRITINAYNFGGDPYETLGIAVKKNGRYSFQYKRRKSTYFYADQHEAEGALYDPFTFNFDRISDDISFKYTVNDTIDLFLNFDRYSKKGDSSISLDINRTEFEFDKPIQEDFREIAVGVDLHVQRYSFLFEEKIMDYENSNSFFLPGYADRGTGARYPSSLNLFHMDQPYDLHTATHTFKLRASPIDNLLIQGTGQISSQDMDLAYSEEADGIDYLGKFFMYTFSGNGSFDRQFQLYDADVTYVLFNNLAIVGGFRYHDFEQEGSLDIDGQTREMALNFNTTSIEGGFQYQLSPDLGFTIGYRNEVRDLDGAETVTFEDQTTRNGFFGNIKWNIPKFVKLTADYHYGTYDDPYTLISPTNFHRFRFTAKAMIKEFNFSGSYLYNKSENDVYDNQWDSTKNQISLRAGYHSQKLQIFGGYSYTDVEHKSDRNIAYPPSFSGPAGTFLWEIFYEGKSSLLDVSLTYAIEKNWRFGAYGNIYTNNGFWEIDRTMIKGYVEYMFDNGLITQVGYRFVDFEEVLSGFNDYSANIFEISFGYRWK